MERPTLQEWKKDNPEKSMNEYFKEYPPASDKNSGNSTVNYIPTIQTIQINRLKEKETIDIVSILVSIMIFVAFFLPWVDVKLLGMFDFVKCSGFKLPNILENVYQGLPPRALKSIYLIPICAFVAIVAETQKSWVKPVAQSIAILISIYWFYLLWQLIYYSGHQLGVQLDPMNFFSFGMYLTCLGCIFYVYEVIKECFI